MRCAASMGRRQCEQCLALHVRTEQMRARAQRQRVSSSVCERVMLLRRTVCCNFKNYCEQKKSQKKFFVFNF